MSKSVVICNIMYCQPGRDDKGKAHSNHDNHLRYIATRPGADRGDVKSLRIGDDDRVNHGEHTAYITDRPGSTGLFGHPDLGSGASGGPEWQDVAQELDGHTLPVWRIVVSLREDVAHNLGMTSRAEWEAAMRQAAHSAIKAMHLDPDQARWVGAYHQAQGHPHAHIVIWERPHEVARRDGHLERGEIKGVWRSYAGELFRSERERLTAEKTAMRDLVRDLTEGDISRLTGMDKARLEVQALDGSRPGLPPTLQPKQEQELMRRLEALARIMPTRGRVGMAYMPPSVKAEARAVADWLLTQPRFAEAAGRHDAAAAEIAGHYSRQPAALEQARQNARDDLRDRVAQVVLRGASILEKESRREKVPEDHAADLMTSAWRHIGHIDLAADWPRATGDQLSHLTERLTGIAEELADVEHKQSLAYLPVALQEEAREIADWIISQPGYDQVAATWADQDKARDVVAERVVLAAKDMIPSELGGRPLMVVHEGRALECLAALQGAGAKEGMILAKDEAHWTAGMLYRAMVSAGLSRGDAEAATRRWAASAQVETVEEVIRSENGRLDWLRTKQKGPGIVGAKDWERLCYNLGLDQGTILRPWIARPPEPDRQIGADLDIRLETKSIAPALQAIQAATGKPDDPQELRWTLRSLAAGMRGMGVDEAVRNDILRGYLAKSGINLPERAVRDMLDRVTAVGRDDHWMGRGSWERLGRNMGFDSSRTNSPWIVQERAAVKIARGVWAAAWRGLEQEKTRMEARAKLAATREERAKEKAKRREAGLERY
jgi:hypothetical protein